MKKIKHLVVKNKAFRYLNAGSYPVNNLLVLK